MPARMVARVMKAFAYVIAGLAIAALCLYPISLVEDVYPFLLLPALAAVAFGLSLLSTDWVLVGPGTAVLILAYAIALRGYDPLVPVFAVGLFVLLEAIDLAPVLRRRPPPERDVIVAHSRHSASVAALAATVCVAAVVAGRLVAGGPAPLAAVAGVCALAATVIVVVLARRGVDG